MSVFSKIKDFMNRHQRKFLIGGIFIAGSVFAVRYVENFMREWQKKEAIEFIERARKQNHFEAINNTCGQTTLNISASLLDKIYETVNTENLIVTLKNNPKNKVEVWNQLKNQVFIQAACIIYSLVILVVLLKLQLNIVGSYLYKDPTSIPFDMQESYLSLSQHFINVGVKKLANTIENKVSSITENVELGKKMKLSDLETIFWSLQGSLDSDEEGPVCNLKSFIFERDVPTSDNLLSSMLKDTVDLLESEEVKYVVVHLTNRGFMLLSDQLSEFFDQSEPKIKELPRVATQFDNPLMNKKPLAKLIPILNGLLSRTSLPQNLLQDLRTNEKLQTLCANVYESLLV